MTEDVAFKHQQPDQAHLASSDEDALSQLSRVLVDMEELPDNIPLIRRQIRLMLQLGMQSEALNAYARLSSLVMLDESTWASYLDMLIASTPRPLTLDSFVDILERFDQAEKDYLSIPVLLRHIQFVLTCFRSARDTAVPDRDMSSEPLMELEDDVSQFLSADNTRGIISAIVQRGQGSLSQSYRLWQVWLDWEMSFLDDIGESEAAIERIHAMYLERLSSPHTDITATSSSYSTFCSAHSPNDYEPRMVQATEASQLAKKKLSEKRYGKTREDFEQQLTYSTDHSSQIQILVEYASWESDSRARVGGRAKSPIADNQLASAVFERAVAEYAKAAALAQDSLEASKASLEEVDRLSKKKGKQKGQSVTAELDAARTGVKIAGQTLRAYKDAEASLWAKYGEWSEVSISPAASSQVRGRAVRACPHVGNAWGQLLLDLERNDAPLSDLTATFERALGLGVLETPDGHTADVVSLFLCRASYESRVEPADEVQGSYHPVIATVTRGLETVSTIDRGGDTTLKLEKFILAWAETRAPQYLDQALAIVEKPSKARSASYQMILLHTDVLTRSGRVDAAREAFGKAIQRSDLDWPEAVYEGFLQLEHVHGSLDTLLEARRKIEREQEKLLRRRERQALEAQQYQTEVSGLEAAQEAAPQPTVVDQTNVSAAAPEDTATHAKRDREHTTILVNGLPKNTTTTRIEAFFTECGSIRETVIISNDDADSDAALVEFARADAVPDALAKDRKKLDGHEVHISMLWRSTLFVTNFAREIDDDALRVLFSQYGKILQTRWPSRKYADSRRFCYITMESPAAAQEALILHGYKAGGDSFGLTVLISDPSAKTKRSDASNSTLFIGGLNAKTTEMDVRSLLRDRGTIRHLKLGWDPVKGICKGFAFVEMGTEAEAKACMDLHGTQFHGRYLKVELSDPNHANKKPVDKREPVTDRRARLVRLSNLPDDVQEGLLQQALEKIVPVKRLELFAKSHDAVAELHSQADAGKLLLGGEPFMFGGKEIQFSEQTQKPAVETVTNTTFAPRAARKGKVLAKPRPTTTLRAAPPPAQNAGDSGNRQDDFRALVNAKNKQREDKLADAKGEKRKSEHEEHEAKRTRT